MKLEIGKKVEWKKMIMVITAETEKSYSGYHEYKGKKVGKLILSKSTLTNPHLSKDIKLVG
tara:strand:- start:1451 stop:1633 length:183 start_codon:yes stop_codon:yes gene_type:complete